MKAAFLFVKKYPNSDWAFQVLRRMNQEEKKGLDTYIRAGIWGFDDPYSGIASSDLEQRKGLIGNIFVTTQGNVWSLNEPLDHKFLYRLATESIYVVQFDSIRRTLAFSLHKRLSEVEGYLGFTQVLPQVQMHRQVFSSYGPLLKLEQGEVFVLFSEFDDSELFADEVLEWLRTHYTTLFDIELVQSVSKRNIGSRFSIFDASDNPHSDFDIEQVIQILGDEWGVQSEQTIYKMRDIAPDAVDELLSGIKVLSRPDLSSADCAQVAVNFRRCLEKIAEAITPPLSSKEKKESKQKGVYKFRLGKYVKEKLSQTTQYGDYLESELDELSTRIEKLYNTGNKGVHEDWLHHAFSVIALRLVLLADDLLTPRRIVKPRVIYEPSLFEDE